VLAFALKKISKTKFVQSYTHTNKWPWDISYW